MRSGLSVPSAPSVGRTGLSLGLFASVSAGVPLPIVPLASIDANGWQADYSGTPPSTVLYTGFSATGLSGYDDTGAVVSNVALSTGLRITRRTRVPGTTGLTALKVGLSYIIPQGGTVAGVTNGSTRAPPPAVANWATRFNQVIGNGARRVAVVAAHYYARGGKQVACAEFTVSDGTTTFTRKTSTMTVLTDPTDKKSVYGYEVEFTAGEMAALANGQITYQSNLYPIIGTAASVARTSDYLTRGMPTWKFAPRYDIKDPARVATPPRCYLDTALGNNTTGVWSTNDATAAAAPFLTMAGALATAKVAAIPAGDVLPSGVVDGCEMRGRAGTHVVAGSGVSVGNKGAELICTIDPAASKATVTYEQGATGPRMRFGATGLYSGMQGTINFKGCSYLRTGAGLINGDTQRINFTFTDCAFNIGSTASGMSQGSVDLWFWGVDFTNVANGALSVVSPGGITMRGCTGNINDGVLMGYNILGCAFSRVGTMSAGTSMNQSNATIAFNKFLDSRVGIATIAGDLDGFWWCGNVDEFTGTVNGPSWRISGDAATGNTNHVLEDNNTYAGHDILGRHNDRYVDNDSPAGSPIRTHTWGRSRNNIKVQDNSKHDLFAAPAPNPVRIGGWETHLGVNYDGNFVQFVDAASGGFAREEQGPNSTVGTSNLVGLNPRFKNPQHATAGPTAGAGFGDYRLQRIADGDPFDSPCLVGAEVEMLPGFGTVLGAYPIGASA